jgi:hypothetical protein
MKKRSMRLNTHSITPTPFHVHYPLLSHYSFIHFSLSYTYYTTWLIRIHSTIHLIHRITNPPLDLGLVLGIRPLINLGGGHSTLILMLLILDIDIKKIGGVKRKMN